MNEGDYLKKWIKKQRSSPPKLAKQLGISKSAIYYQLDLEQLSASFVEKLERAGINIFKKYDNNTNKIEENKLNEPYIAYESAPNYWKEKAIFLTNENMRLLDIIDALTAENNLLKQQLPIDRQAQVNVALETLKTANARKHALKEQQLKEETPNINKI